MGNKLSIEPPEDQPNDDTSDPYRELDALVARRVMKLPRVEKKYVRFDPECGTDIRAYDLTAEFVRPPKIDYCYQSDEAAESERLLLEEYEKEPEFYARHRERGIRDGYKLVPEYSTDIADAWEVVEKLVGEGHVFIVKGDGLRDGSHPNRWTVLCDNLPRIDNASAPEAICRAALALSHTEE